MHIQVIKITPEMAAGWLGKNGANRPIRKYRVRAYAEEMLRGRWRVNSQGISIDRDGRLVDGQHRLSAIVLAGVTVEMAVIFDAPGGAGVAETYDGGLLRTNPDALHFHGVDNSKAVSSIVAAMRRYSRPLEGFVVTLPSMMVSLFEKYGSHASFALSEAGNIKAPTTSPFLAVVARADYHGVDRAYLSAFISIVKSGAPIERSDYEDTPLLLGRTLVGDNERRHRAGSESAKRITYLTERALLAYSKCERLTQIRVAQTNPWPLTK